MRKFSDGLKRLIVHHDSIEWLLELGETGFGATFVTKGHDDSFFNIELNAIRFAEESPEPGPELLEATTYKGEFAR